MKHFLINLIILSLLCLNNAYSLPNTFSPEQTCGNYTLISSAETSINEQPSIYKNNIVWITNHENIMLYNTKKNLTKKQVSAAFLDAEDLIQALAEH